MAEGLALATLHAEYANVKSACATDWKSVEAGDSILNLASISLGFLEEECEFAELVSKVPGKDYFSFRKNGVVARPANSALFIPNAVSVEALWEKWLAGTIGAEEFGRLAYTVSLAPCLAMEIFDRQNKKGPATYFECYIGHLFARAVGVNPTKTVRLPLLGRDVLMTMDFLFERPGGRGKLHLPVKMSTRERVVQAWAHQRLLDSAFGVDEYKGIMVLFSETKLDSKSLEVIEICVPEQWLAYQMLLSRMERIYYFDMPGRYEVLTNEHPEVITILRFEEFLNERGAIHPG